jgi:sarcosine oxidase subunit gamma
MADSSILVPSSPFSGVQFPAVGGQGIVIDERRKLGLASVLARKGSETALAQRVRERFSLALPGAPTRAVAGDVSFAGTGPGAWLAAHERESNAFASGLARAMGDLASVSDQTDAYAVLRLSGPGVREILCKLVSIDVHPRAFQANAVAVTAAGHVGVILWRLEDGGGESPVFEIAAYRSFAASFWRALAHAAHL